MGFLSFNNLQLLNISEKLRDKLNKIRQSVKETGKKKGANKITKSDLFNHSHYNLLFLKITKKTLKHIETNKRDLELHEKVYGIDFKVENLY